MIDKNNVVPCIDWFRGVLPVSNVRKFIFELGQIDKRLHFDMFNPSNRQLLNFSNKFCHVEVPSLSFAFNRDETSVDFLTASLTHNNSGILVNLSGDAIRYLGSDTLRNVLYYLFKNGVKCTRIDYALDFYDKDNELVPLMLDGCRNFLNPGTRDVTVSGKIKRCPSNWSMYINESPGYDKTESYSLGNHGSDHGMFRLYDKFFEVSYGRHSDRADELLDNRNYWYRAELELHNSKDVWWANDSFYNLVNNDFNLYAIIGHAFDMWFDFKIKRFESASIYDDIPLWNEFISELTTIIHFVQLVKDKFIRKDTEYMWQQIIRLSKYLSLLDDVGMTDPERYNNILSVARDERKRSQDYQLRYGGVEVDIEMAVRI